MGKPESEARFTRAKRAGGLGGAAPSAPQPNDEARLPFIPADTEAEAWRVQIEVYRHMGPQARVRLVAAISEDVRQIALSGIRERHPEYTPEAARQALFRLLLGDDLMRKAWPVQALVDP